MYTELHNVAYYFYPLLKNVPDTNEISNFKSALMSTSALNTESLLYIHVPFCNDLCKFCPFHVKISQNDDSHNQYVRSMIREMRYVSALPYIHGRKFKAVYFGGGSPSVLSVELLAEIFSAMHKYFNIEQDAEITFEGEPRGLSSPLLLDYLESQGVSRISFGLQTFVNEIRHMFNIAATLDDVDKAVEGVRSRGFQELNVDMLYDLPGQTLENLEFDLERLRKYDFDSVDYYNLHYYAFPKKMRMDMDAGALPGKPSQTMHFSLFERINSYMADIGYHNVADQIYSKEPRLSEYFRVLWGGRNGAYQTETVAIGASARGYLRGWSYMNKANTGEYIRSLDSDYPDLIEKVSDRLAVEANRREVYFLKFFNLDLNSYPLSDRAWKLVNRWRQDGYVYVNNDYICVSEYGKKWINNMMLDMFEDNQRELARESLVRLIDLNRTRTGTF